MYKLFASLLGILIALMLSINGVLAGKIGNINTLPIVHIAGVLTVSIWLIFVKEKKYEGKVPIYLNLGGMFGIFLVLMNNRCFDTLGASLTLSLGIIGQTFGSIIADSTGFLGMKKYPFNPKKIFGLTILLLGIVIMTERWHGDIINMTLAFTAGIFVILSLIFNSQLSQRVGIFHGVRRNYLVGLACTLIVLFYSDFSLPEVTRSLSSINPLFLVGGGFIGVLVVAGSNFVLPKIPVVYTTILIFGGQAVAGNVIDYIISGEVSLRKIIGTLVIVAGLLVNTLLDRDPDKPRTASRKISP